MSTTTVSVFRRALDGHVTDVFEDASVWVRDGEYVTARDIRDTDVLLDYGPAMNTFAGMRAYLADHEECEGLVFVHADGREATVTRQDFGL